MSEPITHLCFDLETLGVFHDAVVLSIACVPFSLENNEGFAALVDKGFYLKLSVQDQVRNYGRKIEDDTIDWWKKQGADAKTILRPSTDDYCLAPALQALDRWIADSRYNFRESYLWSRGNCFDFGKIESMYHDVGLKEPYNGFMQRDIRTMVDVLCGTNKGRIKPMGPRPGMVAHNALHDAANDAQTMCEIYQSMMEGD